MISPILQNLCSQSSLSLDNFSVIKGMDKDGIVLFLVFSGLCDGIVKGGTSQDNIEPFASESLYTFDFKLWSDGRHKDGSLDFEGMAAIGDTLGVVSGTGSDDTSFFLLLSKGSEGVGGSSDFEAPNGLHIFSFEVYFGVIFFGEILRLGEGSVHSDSLAFSIRLVNRVGRDQLGLMCSIDMVDSVGL